MMIEIIEISKLNKTYAGKFQALTDVDLSIKSGEIFALLGPNGAGKTTLISMICGLVRLTSGTIRVDGKNIEDQPRDIRQRIGLVPQELTTNMFETVWDTVQFTRGLFGFKKNNKFIENLLKSLSLWDKRKNTMMTLSGGMKRRVMIAKALAHEPDILFLDEPTAGVDVSLRKDMWTQLHALRKSGVTIILTTHYIEEAEEMADRIGVINNGKIVIVEKKEKLIKKLGKKHISFKLDNELKKIPKRLANFKLTIKDKVLHYEYDSKNTDIHISNLFDALKTENITYKDITTKQSSLEEIFVELVKNS
ncbi:ABC transporter ATP-binding protein [bacterium]|nr:ABC transporter ATP-binding protein [bacterium]